MLSSLTLPFVALAVLAATLDATTPAAPCPQRAADRSTFEFASNPWLNLYNFLVKQAKHARGVDDDGLGARGYLTEDTAAVRPLTPLESAEWTGAVEFFAGEVLPDRLGIDSLVVNVNNVLARIGPNDNIDVVPLHPEVRRVLRTVMPIYWSAWWPAHDRRNQRWITSMQAALAGRERCLVQRAESVFRAPWPTAPLHVDATVYASWFGAYSSQSPTRITVSANARGAQASFGVEVLLHEAAHAMLGPLDSALAQEAARRKRVLPGELSHLILFYTAGALIKEQDPTHPPFAEEFEIWQRNQLAKQYHDAIAKEWQPYLSGSRSFREAIAALVERIR